MAIPPPAQIPKKRGVSCFGCGCAILALIALLLVALVAGGIYYFYTSVRGFTDITSVEIAQFDGGEQVYQHTEQKLDAFRQNPGRSASLHLSADEINTLIARDPSFATVRGHLFVTLKGNEATIQTSLPLSAIESFVMTDRYLNGDATFALGFDPQGKNVEVDMHVIHVKDRTIPPANEGFNQSFNRLFNQKLQSNPAVRDFLSRTQKIAVENGEFVIETQ
jgi:hypothetical protein